jgi:HlyD family type I secretion membrane fusion protein
MSGSGSAVVAELLRTGAESPEGRLESRSQLRSLVVPVLIAVAIGVVWSAVAPLSGAVVANARVKAEFNRKTIQHQEGGIVREILVRNGQEVHAGQPLLILSDIRVEADYSLLQDRHLAARARLERVEAEAQLSPRFVPSPDLSKVAAAGAYVGRERASFDARRKTLDEQTHLFQTQVRELLAQAVALESQIEATGASARLSDEELAINTKLADEGFVQRTRLIALQRVSADYRSRIGEHRSDLAAARQRAGEVQARVAQLRQQYQVQAMEERKEAASELREIEEKLRPARDHLERQIVRSPVNGQIMQMRVASVGATIGPREPLLDVAPQDERLVIEARVEPHQIEQVQLNARAHVRLMGADAHSQPVLPATVVFLSPDLVTSPSGSSAWFDVTVEVDAEALKHQSATMRVQAGMPAEVYVTTRSRTLLQYLLKPLNLFVSRGMREV